jgi:hypothetical protein
MARHTSVSWNLMVGRNPLLVAKKHGHRPTTMLSVYAAWTEGAVEADITAIRKAMNRADGDGARQKRLPTGPGSKRRRRPSLDWLSHVRTDGREHVDPSSQGTAPRPEGDLAVASRPGVVSRWKIERILVEREGLEGG